MNRTLFYETPIGAVPASIQFSRGRGLSIRREDPYGLVAPITV